ncbi:substrate-binding periplasmic protein [Simiduia agarivorans]|uniref:ABC transporter substrate-binding protein n=1 Tax=Simiduia agarivorans (strain DSM 21679 / JCM 13881 / BCRC 17597 / SA1) TaxID=1117647 RepID=K4KXQ9_SIMAS|nr:transporter substrate-binding domain-containing protein [Simiduia agarivorans]AFU98692.1 ABC transporter substrate-binding protein [Simiduia agarivorans SA1 = DSM 21679]
MRLGVFTSLLVWLSLSSLPRAETDTVKLVSDLYCPFVCAVGAPQEGYLVDLVRAATADASTRVTYAVYPWERALVMVRQAQADGILAVSQRRSEGLLLSSVIGFDTVAITSLEPLPAASSTTTVFDWLDRYRLGVVTFPLAPASAYEQYLAARKTREPGGVVTVAGENASALLVRMLIAGRVSAAMENPQVIKHLLHQEFPDVAFWQRVITEPRPLYIGLRDTPANRQWLAQFEAGLARMRADGRLAALMARYGLVDWYGGAGQ